MPLTCEARPNAVVALPSACDAGPPAVLPTPSACEEGPLAVELLQEVALEVRAAADFEDLEHAGEARVMGVRMRLAEEELHPVVQVFQPQERSYALVQGVFVGNHGPRLGMAAIVADAAAFSQ